MIFAATVPLRLSPNVCLSVPATSSQSSERMTSAACISFFASGSSVWNGGTG
jgi:hypothetical protein